MYLPPRDSMKHDHELLRAEQIIRPTGLLDPKVEVRPVEGQIDDLIGEVNKETAKKAQGPDHYPYQNGWQKI